MVQKNIIQYLKTNHPLVKYVFYFSDSSSEQYKNRKNFLNLCHHNHDFIIGAEWIFFGTSHGKSPCDGIGGFVKRYVAKRSLQRPLHNQILNYKAMLDLCKAEIDTIEFFGISQEEMIEVRKSLKNRFDRSKRVPGTRASHHFIPQSCNTIAHKLTSEDEKFIDTFDFDKNYIEPINVNDIKSFSYVSCVSDDFRWIGLVEQVNED